MMTAGPAPLTPGADGGEDAAADHGPQADGDEIDCRERAAQVLSQPLRFGRRIGRASREDALPAMPTAGGLVGGVAHSKVFGSPERVVDPARPDEQRVGEAG